MKPEIRAEHRDNPPGWTTGFPNRRWLYDWIACDHDRAVLCSKRCTRRCGYPWVVLPPCRYHLHCDRCGAINCHGGWWRFKDPGTAHWAQGQPW